MEMTKEIIQSDGAETIPPAQTEYVKLNSGYNMPALGLGTWTLSDDKAEEIVYFAIKNGYRLIDTARYYNNEIGVGRGVRRAISEGVISREKIFVTSKVMPGDYRRPDAAIDDSLERLGLGYIDLMLVHQPGAGDEEVYKALERGVRAGKIRSIGISNYYTPEAFERINRIAEIVPAVVQNENHPFYQNKQLQEYLRQYGTVVEAWYPFGGRGNTQKVFQNETIKEIASRHGKTSAQIVLRWQIQDGYIVIPGSGNSQHIAENAAIFDFALSDDDMQQMKELNTNRRFENW
jgi:diketogulonate reductase-like aldo/keto reductase